MPSVEAPSFNSSRIQRAYRINNIEQARLQQHLHLLEKERIHSMRVTNQDIRLISVTMDYIQSCSGHSPEGLAPDADIASVQEEPEVDDLGNACFMYGERIVSRKRRRFKRPQSAMDSSSSRRSESQASIPAKVNSIIRPQSSPVKRDTTFITTLRDNDSSISDTESVWSGMSSASGYDQPWMHETSEVTKKLLRASRQNSTNLRRTSLHERQPKVRVRGSLGGGAFNMNSLAKELDSKGDKSLDGRRSSRSSFCLSRNAGISDIMSQRRPTLTADAWKKHLSQSKANASPMTVSAKRQQVMDLKLEMNEHSRAILHGKVKSFMDKE